LNNPPLIRKNTHAFTAREKPKLKAMNNNCEGLLGVPTVLVLLAGVARSATCVPEKAKKRKRVVPAYSALVATKWFRGYSIVRFVFWGRSRHYQHYRVSSLKKEADSTSKSLFGCLFV
jgi:hypothetical protein